MCMVEEVQDICWRSARGIVCQVVGGVGGFGVTVYGAEVWGCCRQIGPVEQVQMRAARVFLGVERQHSKVAQQYKMMILPLVWEARRRCIEFWVKIMRMDDKRMIRMVALVAWESQSKVKWVEDLK